jgi:hypothetical protein
MFDYRLVISRQGVVRQSSKLDHKNKTEESSASIRRSAVVGPLNVFSGKDSCHSKSSIRLYSVPCTISE